MYGNIYDRSKELKNTSKYLTLLPQRIACYLTAYFDEKSPFERVVHFEVFNVHKKRALLLLAALLRKMIISQVELGPPVFEQVIERA